MAADADRERLGHLVNRRMRFLPLEDIRRRLAPVPAGPLLELVFDQDESRDRRAACARALLGRVPPEHAAALVDLGRDETVHLEVRNPVLMSVLSIPDAPDCEDLLRWLRAHEVVDRKGLGVSLNTAILLARAMEGDASAVAVLAELAADPWWTERTDAEHAIEALIEARGPAVVPSALGCGSMQALARHGRSPAERLLGVRCLWREGGDIAACLADDSALVARKAYEFLTGSDVADENLLAMVRERRPGCVWALAVLHERGRDIRPLWGGDGPPRVELPGVPSDVREAIVRRYTPGQRDTDPRWLVEAALLEPPPPREDVEDLIENRLELAFQTLRAAGLEPQEPQSAGRFHGLGGGTYHLIETDVGRVCLSTLGPFFSVADRGEQARAALQVAGFRHIGKELASIEFSKLHVYFFGDREPLKVYDLLFYWQD